MILVDTGPLVAIANVRDDAHVACTRLLEGIPDPLLVPAPVLTEVCNLLESRCEPELEAEFLADAAEGCWSWSTSLALTWLGWPSWFAPTRIFPWARWTRP